MTVASAVNRKTFAGDDATTSFATTPIKFFETSDLKVYVTTDATGVTTLLTEGTHYTVSGGDASAGAVGTVSTAGGSSPHGALLTGTTLVVVRELPLLQGVDFVNNDASDADTAEGALDKVTMIHQRLNERMDRAVRLPDGDVSGATPELPAAGARASSVLGFDADGEFTTYDASSAVTEASNVTFLQSGTGAIARTVDQELAVTVRPSQFNGADASIKINQAITALLTVSTTGGIVDATDLTGTQTWSQTVNVGTAGKPVWLKLGRASFSITSGVGSGAAINIVAEGSAVTGFPVGAPSSNGAGTIFTSATGHTGQIVKYDPGASGDSRITVADIFADANNIATNCFYFDNFAGITLRNLGAARATGANYRIGVTAGSYTAQTENLYSKDPATISYHISATLVRLYGVSDGGTISVQLDGTDGNNLVIDGRSHFEGATTRAIYINGTGGENTIQDGCKIFPFGKNASGVVFTNTALQTRNRIGMVQLIGQGDGTGTGIGIDVQGTNAGGLTLDFPTIRGFEYPVSLIADDSNLNVLITSGTNDGVAIAGSNNRVTGRIAVSGTNAVAVSSGSGNQCSVVSSQAFSGIVNLIDDAGVWTPTDASGAALAITFSNARYVRNGRMITASCKAVYPATADATAAAIGGLPYTSENSAADHWGGVINASDLGLSPTPTVLVTKNAKTLKFYNNAFSTYANSSLSGKTINLTVHYEMAV